MSGMLVPVQPLFHPNHAVPLPQLVAAAGKGRGDRIAQRGMERDGAGVGRGDDGIDHLIALLTQNRLNGGVQLPPDPTSLAVGAAQL